MILRIFTARIRAGREAEFERMVREQSIPWLEASDGMLGYLPGKPRDEGQSEFVMVTLWKDIESLEKFAGPDWQTPVVTGEETPLVEEMHAVHYTHFGEAYATPEG